MVRSFLIALFFFLLVFPHPIQAQPPAQYKSFNQFTGLVHGVDFFASSKKLVEPYEAPVAETIGKLENLLGNNLPKGSIFICSTLEQKDSIYEPMILKMGYAWTLSIETSDIRAQQMMERMKSMMGDQVPAEMLERFKSRPANMADTGTIKDTVRRIAYAVIQTSFAKNLRYRSSRLNDMGKSPLPDWLDIGIGDYATGEDPNLSYLQQNLDQTFSIEDILTMSRPFVASLFLQSSGVSSGTSGSRGGNRGGMGGGQGFPAGGMGGGQGFPAGGMGGGQGFPAGGMGGGQGFPAGGMGGGQGFPAGGMGGGQGFPAGGMGGGQGFPAGGMGGMGQGGGPPGGPQGFSGREGGQRGGFQRTIPKDEQDQMIFDGQSSTFFAFLLEKVGIEKVRKLIKAVDEGTEGREFVAREDMLGNDFGKIEREWLEWMKNLKPEPAFSRPGPPGAKEAN
jgi:hypothetical protein